MIEHSSSHSADTAAALFHQLQVTEILGEGGVPGAWLEIAFYQFTDCQRWKEITRAQDLHPVENYKSHHLGRPDMIDVSPLPGKIWFCFVGVIVTLVFLLVLSSQSDQAGGEEIIVDEQGGGNFTDVSHALSAVDEGDVITIRSGNYSANYLRSRFKDNLTIKGNGSNSTRLIFSTSYSSIMVENSSVAFSGINFTSESSVSEGIGNQIFAYNGSGITFRDCTFHRISRVAIYYYAWNTTFENNSFIDSDLFFYVGSGEQISSSTILNNTYNRRPIHFLTDQNKPEIPKDQGGLTLINCTNVTIRDWEKTETSLGIKLYYCKNVIVENCTIRSLGYPIDIGVCDNVTIVDSIISGYDRGVYISGDKSLVDGCEILNNTFGIIFVSGEHTVRNCIIVQNSDQGIKVDDSFRGEDFDRADISVDARYNYWGSVNGPYHPEENPSGWGDTVGDGVLFSPWHESRDFVPFEALDGEEDGKDREGKDPDVMGLVFLLMVLSALFVVLVIFVIMPAPVRKL